MKKKNTKLKVLGVAAAMVMVMGATAATTWAFTRTNYESNFKATFVGSRNVEATIDAASYLSSQEESIETLETVTFSKSSTASTETASFTNAVAVINAGDYAYYDFKITNKSTSKSYTDLIVEPVITNTNESVVTSLYYSVNGESYQALTDNFLNVQQNGSITLRVIATPVDGAEDIEFTGGIKFNLNTENDKPAGYTQAYTYAVSGETVTRTKVYSTGYAASPETMTEGTYEIVDSDSVQSVLDSDINGKVIIFSADTYDTTLLLRPSYATSKVYLNTADLTDDVADEEQDKDNLVRSTDYRYLREINDVTFYAEDGATFSGLFDVEAKRNLSTQYEAAGTPESWDAVRNQDIVGAVYNGYYSHLILNNITIDNMDFSGAKGRVLFNMTTEGSIVNDLTVRNCTFNTTELESEDVTTLGNAHAAIFVDTTDKESVNGTNLSFKNNIISGHYQGIVLSDVKNVVLDNNAISKTIHNSIACQAYTNAFEGNIIIANNKLSDTIGETQTGERAIRFGVGSNANLIIINNNFVNSTDGSDILKTEPSTNTTYSLAQNTYAVDSLSEAYELKTLKGTLNSTQLIVQP